ncbi:MAG: polyprenyl synthetase family protein [Bacteroidetes bacterium]|nr:polyprenyl synthetase family protein [Bacteroidota bacterium]
MSNTKGPEDLIDESLAALKFPASPAELYEPIRYTLDLGGKRLRPRLVLMACRMFGQSFENALQPALGIEVFHNFTLLHDDIMDEAPLRRGRPTVHKRWNSNIAILSGDVMFVEACRLMSQAPPETLTAVLDVFYRAATQVCEGQQYDMNFEQRNDVSISEYLEMIRLKTAVLIGAALEIGALCAKASAEDAALLYNFGCDLGTAFQLTDDILDVYGDPEKFGKQVGGDILANKKTFLSLKAFELAGSDTASELRHWYNERSLSTEKVQRVTAIFNELNIRREAENAAEELYRSAMDNLKKLQAKGLDIKELEHFANTLMQREF